jgi:hypothetical protein
MGGMITPNQGTLKRQLKATRQKGKKARSENGNPASGSGVP